MQSAGIYAGNGSPASQGTIEALQAEGVSINHKSQPVTPELIAWADLILTMTTQHKQAIVMQHPTIDDKLYTLKEYVLQDTNETWEKLKKAYAELEEKRAAFMKERGQGLSPIELERALSDALSKEIREIQELELNLPNYDISDPFGGNSATYQKTLKEMEKYIELLTKKLDNKN